MPDLKPNDDQHDNGPAVRSKLIDEGFCFLDDNDYYMNPIQIPMGVCFSLVGVSSGHRHVHNARTRIRPIEPLSAGKALIDVSVASEVTPTARGVEIANIMFQGEGNLGSAIWYRAADLWKITDCSFWYFDSAVELGEIGQPLKTVEITYNQFIYNYRGVRSVRPAPATVTGIRVITNKFHHTGTNDLASPGGCVTVNGGRAHLVAGNHLENNPGRGVTYHDVKSSSIRDNDMEDNLVNIKITGSSTRQVEIGLNSLDSSGVDIAPEAMAHVIKRY